MKNEISVEDFRIWIDRATDDDVEDLLGAGLEELIFHLESDDFFGTEGFMGRYK